MVRTQRSIFKKAAGLVAPAAFSKTQTGDASPGRVSTSRASPAWTIAKARQYANAARAGSGWASSLDDWRNLIPQEYESDALTDTKALCDEV